MRKTIIIIAGLFLFGCGTYQPIRGTYPIHPTIREIDRPFDKVWTELIAFITTSGIQIQTIEKASGLLVSSDFSFEGTVTYEKGAGKLREANDWIVCSFIGTGQSDALIPSGNKQNSKSNSSSNITKGPTKVTGNFNVHVVEVGANKTSVSVNIGNLRATGDYKYDAKSTGVFEKMLLDKLEN